MKSQAYLHRPVTPSIGRQSKCCWNSKQAPRRERPHCVSWVFYQRCYWLISSEEEGRRRTWGNGWSQSAFRGEWKKPFKTEGDREQRTCSAPVGELRPQWAALAVCRSGKLNERGRGGLKGQLMAQTLVLTWQTSEIPSTREQFSFHGGRANVVSCRWDTVLCNTSDSLSHHNAPALM